MIKPLIGFLEELIHVLKVFAQRLDLLSWVSTLDTFYIFIHLLELTCEGRLYVLNETKYFLVLLVQITLLSRYFRGQIVHIVCLIVHVFIADTSVR
jgi:hypothetical protein